MMWWENISWFPPRKLDVPSQILAPPFNGPPGTYLGLRMSHGSPLPLTDSDRKWAAQAAFTKGRP